MLFGQLQFIGQHGITSPCVRPQLAAARWRQGSAAARNGHEASKVSGTMEALWELIGHQPDGGIKNIPGQESESVRPDVTAGSTSNTMSDGPTPDQWKEEGN